MKFNHRCGIVYTPSSWVKYPMEVKGVYCLHQTAQEPNACSLNGSEQQRRCEVMRYVE